MKSKKSVAVKKDIPIVKKMSPKLKKGDLKKKIKVTQENSNNKGQKSTLQNTSVISPGKKKMDRKSSKVSKKKIEKSTNRGKGQVTGQMVAETKKGNLKRKADDAAPMDCDTTEVESPGKELSNPKMKSLNRKQRKKEANLLQKNSITSEDSQQRKKDIAIEYLKKWKDDRENWKFRKNQQIWMNDNAMDNTRVPDDLFPVWIEYMDGAAEGQKKLLVSKATKIIEELEDEDSTVDPGDVKCQRARTIIQTLSVGEDESSS